MKRTKRLSKASILLLNMIIEEGRSVLYGTIEQEFQRIDYDSNYFIIAASYSYLVGAKTREG